ncbi:MAG: hypothetical protein AB1646_16800 [Thermodesulfobacteriota bacterium]
MLYKIITQNRPDFALGLIKQQAAVCGIVANFAFTMLGFLGAIIALLFSLSDSRRYARYKTKGYLDVFFGWYFLTIAMLCLTLFLSMVGFSEKQWLWSFRVLFMLLVNDLVAVGLILWTIVKIAWDVSKAPVNRKVGETTT